MSTPQFSVGIVGGGPAGLTAARRLQLAGIPYTVFELRSQEESFGGTSGASGSLDLRPNSGLLALRRLELWKEYEALIRPGSEDTQIGDMTGEILHFDQGDPDHSAPELDRKDLIALLRNSIPLENIKFCHKLLSVSAAPNNRWHLQFQGHEDENYEFDVVIGADGAWSRVRNLLTEVKPFYSGINSITVHLPDAAVAQPRLSKIVGSGNYWCFGEHKSVQSQRGATGTIRSYLMLQRPEPEFTYAGPNGTTIDLKTLSPRELLETLTTHKDLYGNWGDDLKALINASSKDPGLISLNPLWMLPIGNTWESLPGITLVGDAAHLATPFAGEGANAAMLDALEVADELVKAAAGEKTIAEATSDYEKSMWPRVKGVQEESYNNISVLFGDNAAREFAAFMERMMSEGGPPPDRA